MLARMNVGPTMRRNQLEDTLKQGSQCEALRSVGCESRKKELSQTVQSIRSTPVLGSQANSSVVNEKPLTIVKIWAGAE